MLRPEQRAPAVNVDVYSKAFTDRASDGYAELRALGPIVWNRANRCFLITTHDDCLAVLRSKSFGGIDPVDGWRTIAERTGRDYSCMLKLFTFMPTHHECHRHHWLRRALAVAVSPLARSPDAIEALVARRVDQIRERSSFDFVDDFSRFFFFDIMCDLMGLDASHRDQIRSIANKSWAMDALLSVARRDRLEAAIRQAMPVIVEHVEEHIHKDGSFAEAIYRELPEDERSVESAANLLLIPLVMGNDAVSGTLAYSVAHLLSDPERRRLVPQQNWDRIGDDALRFVTPIHATSREATEDTSIGKTPIYQGETVLVAIMAGNHDAQTYGEDADTISCDAARDFGLSFGAGFHICVGNRLSREIVRLALAALSRLPPLRLRNGAETGIGSFIRRMDSLPVEFQ